MLCKKCFSDLGLVVVVVVATVKFLEFFRRLGDDSNSGGEEEEKGKKDILPVVTQLLPPLLDFVCDESAGYVTRSRYMNGLVTAASRRS